MNLLESIENTSLDYREMEIEENCKILSYYEGLMGDC